MTNTGKKKRHRQARTKTVVQALAGKKIVALLPDSDKATIMEWLLQQPMSTLESLTAQKEMPAFVICCASMLLTYNMGEYFNLIHRFQQMAGDKD